MRLTRSLGRAATLGLLAGALSLASACAPPPSKLAAGEAFTTNNSSYDEFFTGVREVHAEAQEAKNDEISSHKRLLDALGLEFKTETTALLAEAASRAKKLHDAGIALHLELTPEPKLVAAKGNADPGPNGEKLMKAFEDTARTSLEIRKRLAALGDRAEKLEQQREELEKDIPSAFKNESGSRRDEVTLEMAAAKVVLASASDAANRSAAAAARFVVELAQAVETGAPPGGEGPQKPGKGGKKFVPPKLPPLKKGAPAGGPVAAAPAPKPAAPPAAAPAPKPAGKKPKADDFEP